MQAVYQTRRGVGGNCLQAALASLLELPLDGVPDFMALPDGPRTWPVTLGAWLNERGLEGVPVAPHGALRDVLDHMAEHYCAEPYLLCGRVGEHGHVVVAAGGHVIHDPDPPGSFGATFLGGVPHLGDRYLALLIRPMCAPVLPAPMDFSPLERHERIALAFSGGKDSLATWHALAPYHSRIIVYHADTGDRLPEARRIVQQYRARTLTPWVDVQTDSRAWREAHGLPSDIVPIGSTPTGLALANGEGGSRPIVSRFECCAANRAMPLARRIIDDGVTLLICGTRRADGGFGSISKGSTPGPHPNSLLVGEGVERWMPLLDWSGEDVAAYLASLGVELPAYYGGRIGYSAPVECASCPAVADLAFIRYLKANHPEIAASILAEQRAIREEIVRPLARLRDSLGALAQTGDA